MRTTMLIAHATGGVLVTQAGRDVIITKVKLLYYVYIINHCPCSARAAASPTSAPGCVGKHPAESQAEVHLLTRDLSQTCSPSNVEQ